jgi:hypothetical protein
VKLHNHPHQASLKARSDMEHEIQDACYLVVALAGKRDIAPAQHLGLWLKNVPVRYCVFQRRIAGLFFRKIISAPLYYVTG